MSGRGASESDGDDDGGKGEKEDDADDDDKKGYQPHENDDRGERRTGRRPSTKVP